MKINIAGGTGVMGKVHKPLFENQGHEVIISGRLTTPNLEQAARESDLTIVSVPIPLTEEIIKRLAPYCSAIMDFTSLKIFPIKAMLKYSTQSCEVGGLHPLYGRIDLLEGQTVVYCPTSRSGEKCNEIIDSFKNFGLKVKTMTPERHDLVVNGIAQNARTMALESFALLAERFGVSMTELYGVSPPPTKILLDLLARQVDNYNDELYRVMRDYNPLSKEIASSIAAELFSSSYGDNPKRIRRLFGQELGKAQVRAKELIKRLN